MAKRGLFVSIIVALITFLAPSVLAQGWLIPFDEMLDVMVNNQFFSFLFFFGLFFAACAAALSKVFPGTYGRFIALFLSLIMTVGGVYTGYLDLVTFGPWSLLFLVILIGVGILYFFVMGREKAPNYKVILLVSFVIGLIVISFVPNIPDLIWNWLFAAVIVLGVSGIIALALNLAGGIRLSTGGGKRTADRGDITELPGREEAGAEPVKKKKAWWPHWLSPWRWGRKPQQQPGEVRERRIVEPLHVTIINPQKRPPARNEYQVGDRIPLVVEIIGGTPPYNSQIRVMASGKTTWQRKVRTQGGISFPNIICPVGDSIIRVDVIDSGGKGMLKRGIQSAMDAVTIWVHGAAPSGAKPAEARAERAGGFIGKIISPKGEIKSDKKILLEIDIRGGVAPYRADLFFDGNKVKVGSYDLPNPGGHSLALPSPKGLGMLEGTKHVIEVEFTDREGTRVSDSTEVFIPRPMPGKTLKALPAFTKTTVDNVRTLRKELDDYRISLFNSCINLNLALRKLLRGNKVAKAVFMNLIKKAVKDNYFFRAGGSARSRSAELFDLCYSLKAGVSQIRIEVQRAKGSKLIDTREAEGSLDKVEYSVLAIIERLKLIAKESRMDVEKLTLESIDKWIKKQE